MPRYVLLIDNLGDPTAVDADGVHQGIDGFTAVLVTATDSDTGLQLALDRAASDDDVRGFESMEQRDRAAPVVFAQILEHGQVLDEWFSQACDRADEGVASGRSGAAAEQGSDE